MRDGKANSTQQTLVAGAGYGPPIMLQDDKASVRVIPGGGGSMTVQSTTSPVQDVINGGGNWVTASGFDAVTSTTTDLIEKETAVRASATTANGTLEVCQ